MPSSIDELFDAAEDLLSDFAEKNVNDEIPFIMTSLLHLQLQMMDCLDEVATDAIFPEALKAIRASMQSRLLNMRTTIANLLTILGKRHSSTAIVKKT